VGPGKKFEVRWKRKGKRKKKNNDSNISITLIGLLSCPFFGGQADKQ
jgi:hypothetical protein